MKPAEKIAQDNHTNCSIGMHPRAYTTPDEHERSELIYHPDQWNHKYINYFSFCPFCGVKLEQK